MSNFVVIIRARKGQIITLNCNLVKIGMCRKIKCTSLGWAGFMITNFFKEFKTEEKKKIYFYGHISFSFLPVVNYISNSFETNSILQRILILCNFSFNIIQSIGFNNL